MTCRNHAVQWGEVGFQETMTNINQLFFSIVGLLVIFGGAFKLYLDVKIDPIKKQVDLLVNYMIMHEGKIATLEERTKNL